MNKKTKLEQLLTKPINTLTKDDKMFLINMGNQALRRIENKGYQEDSAAYIMVNKYKDKEKFYNVSTTKEYARDEDGNIVEYEDDKIRFSKRLGDLSKSEERHYMETLQNFLSSKTSSVKGTSEAIKKGFEKYIEKFDQQKFAENGPIKETIDKAIQEAEEKRGKPLTDKMKEKLTEKIKKAEYQKAYMEYRQLWKIYRNNVTSDKKAKAESDRVLKLMTNETYNFYDMSENEKNDAMKYFATHDVEKSLNYMREYNKKDQFLTN